MLNEAASPDETQALRQKGGRWLKTLRENAGLSQRDVANVLGIEYYTFVSQLESGRGRVPPTQYAAFAKAYNVPLREFAKTLLSFYEPVLHYALFEHEEPAEEVEAKAKNLEAIEQSAVTDLMARVARLESKVHQRLGKKSKV